MGIAKHRRRRGHTRIRAENQATIPVAALRRLEGYLAGVLQKPAEVRTVRQNLYREQEHSSVDREVAQGYDATHLRDEGLQRAPDDQVFEKAIAEARVILTFDLDFDVDQLVADFMADGRRITEDDRWARR